MKHSNWKIFTTLVKSWFTCIHFADDCVVDQRVEKYDEDRDTESWHCLCTCKKCGEHGIKKNWTFRKTYLNDLRSAGVE